MSLPLTESPHTQRNGDEPAVPTRERLGRQRGRSIAIAVILGLLVLLFYLVTIVKIGGNILSRQL
ncbi:MAG: hypothetical protein F9K43_00160 [Bauldia sp.]|nr:MAG: hypothetical protein F9K43_00160 [Bauldia sp.]